jgi:hypothetical protein
MLGKNIGTPTLKFGRHNAGTCLCCALVVVKLTVLELTFPAHKHGGSIPGHTAFGNPEPYMKLGVKNAGHF